MAAGQAYDVHRMDKRIDHALMGCQEWLFWADASAANGANPAGLNAGALQGSALAGFRLKDLAGLITAGTLTALAVGTYYVIFQLNGMGTVFLDLNMTFSGGTGVVVNAFSTQKDEQTSRQVFTNSPLTLTTATTNRTLQLIPQGEQYGVMSVVVGAGTTVTAITLAEIVGQRG